jgi:subtilisin family serine protease
MGADDPYSSRPSVIGADDPYGHLQGYLDPAPRGIDARFAWTQPHGTGAGVGLVDVDFCWNTNHEDLKGQLPTLIFGDLILSDHGTGVLGAVVAQDNTVGVIGVAPAPAYVFLTSCHDAANDEYRLAERIALSACLMYPGDVLLLELSNDDGSPIELSDAHYDAIRYAVLMGIVVIEAAGDGGVDLDRTRDHAGRLVLNRASGDFRDSGAILIGASDPRDAHNRPCFSCFGSRVDCFAWGRYVVTCGGGDLDQGGGDPNRKYRRAFNGTSSAAPIVAGAAMILQSRIKARTGRPATPEEMRALLSNPRTGTRQGTRVPGPIGIMPNLRAIIEAEYPRYARKHVP